MRHHGVLIAAVLMLGLASYAEASKRYFDQAELASYTIPNSSTGDTFYVDGVSGSDSYDGLSANPTSGSRGPFKTIAKALDRYRSNFALGGDVIKIKAGIYRESVVFALNSTQVASLTADTPLAMGPYGNGEVVIDPSPHPTSWAAYDGSTFYADWPNASYPPAAVVMGGSFKGYRPKQSLSDLTKNGLWYFDPSARRIYVNTGGVAPATLDPVITYDYTSAEQYCIKTNGNPYLHFYGLTLRGAARYGFSDYPGSRGIVLEKCTIKWNNGNGARIFGEQGVVRKSHVWGNMLYNWPRGRRWAANGGWGQGLTVGGYGLVEGTISHDNGGEGIGVYGGTGHVTFQDNISYDNWSVGLYLDNAGYCTFRRNLVYAHDPDVSDIVEAWQLPSWIISAGSSTITAETNKIIGRLRQEGIMAGDETATSSTAHSIGFKALDNILVGNRRGFTTYGQATGAGLNNYVIAGNTIVLPAVAPPYGAFGGMVLYASAYNSNSVIKNNLIYSYAPAGSTQPLVAFPSSATMSGIDFDNNLYYSANDAAPFTSGSYPNEKRYSFAAWVVSLPSGYDAHSVYADPLFSGTRGGFTAADYLLASASPAVGAGATVADIASDFNAFPRIGAFDVGALQRGSVEARAPLAPSAVRIVQ